jgi:long-chain acyl-CoA synthetase
LVVLAESVRARLPDSDLHERVRGELLKLFDSVNQRLASHERLQRLVIVPEPWSVENGCLTPTMKIRRGRIEAAAASHVDDWTSRPGPIVWA